MSLSPEQKAIRKTRVGASDLGALMGVDPFRTALDVFREKVHDQQRPESAEMRWGQYIEDAALAYYAAETGIEVVRPGSTFIHPHHDFLCVTPDALVYPNPAPVGDLKEVKNAGRWMLDGWDPADELIPFRVRAQTQMALEVTVAMGMATPHGEVIAALGGEPPAFFPVDHDPETCAALREVAEKFWRDCLVPKKEPKGWEKDRSALDYVAQRWKEHDKTLREPTETAATSARQLTVAKKRIQRWQMLADIAKARLCNEIADAAGILGIATWKADRRGVRTLRPWKGRSWAEVG